MCEKADAEQHIAILHPLSPENCCLCDAGQFFQLLPYEPYRNAFKPFLLSKIVYLPKVYQN